MSGPQSQNKIARRTTLAVCSAKGVWPSAGSIAAVAQETYAGLCGRWPSARDYRAERRLEEIVVGKLGGILNIKTGDW